jgi:hypothetical protein
VLIGTKLVAYNNTEVATLDVGMKNIQMPKVVLEKLIANIGKNCIYNKTIMMYECDCAGTT